MNEVFGEENFVATVIWQKVFSPKNSARHFSEDHDYIVVYAKSAEVWVPRLLPSHRRDGGAVREPGQRPARPLDFWRRVSAELLRGGDVPRLRVTIGSS
jgi:adenine-specific DNA-methyltransferase